MANTFLLSRSYRYGGPNGKDILVLIGTLTLDGTSGAAAGDLPASLFVSGDTALRQITGVSSLTISDNSAVVPAAPVADGTSIITMGDEDNSNTPTDAAAGAYLVRIEGLT
jgi:hypothetical protein